MDCYIQRNRLILQLIEDLSARSVFCSSTQNKNKPKQQRYFLPQMKISQLNRSVTFADIVVQNTRADSLSSGQHRTAVLLYIIKRCSSEFEHDTKSSVGLLFTKMLLFVSWWLPLWATSRWAPIMARFIWKHFVYSGALAWIFGYPYFLYRFVFLLLLIVRKEENIRWRVLVRNRL